MRIMTKLYGGTWRVVYRYCHECAYKQLRQIGKVTHA